MSHRGGAAIDLAIGEAAGGPHFHERGLLGREPRAFSEKVAGDQGMRNAQHGVGHLDLGGGSGPWQ